jgi:hypothetical protein
MLHLGPHFRFGAIFRPLNLVHDAAMGNACPPANLLRESSVLEARNRHVRAQEEWEIVRFPAIAEEDET